MIAKTDEPRRQQQFILKPVNGEARLELCKTPSRETPRLRATMLFDEIGFVLDEDQYRDALMLIDLFHFYIRHQQYKKFRPKVSLPENPRIWLKFAVTAVLDEIHERNRKWTWGYFKERRDDRIRYISLFKRKKQSEPLLPNELTELKQLEWKLSYEDLRFYRSLARNQLRKERTVIKETKQKQPQGWFAWAWGAPADAEAQASDDATMTEQQRKELYDAIEWDEKKSIAESIDLPRDSVKMEIEARLQTGSFTLKRRPDVMHDVEIVSLLFDDFKAAFIQRPDSFLSEVSLGGLRVYDGTTAGSLFPQIVRVKSEEVDISGTALVTDSRPAALTTRFDDGSAFFHATFEKNPLDGSADSAVAAKLRSMEIIYNPRFLEEIYKFFRPPERHMESIGALMESAGATVEAVRQQTRAGLEFALEEHKTLNAKLDLQAPLLVIPENVTMKDANCLVIDAGHVSLVSDLVQKDSVLEIQAKQSTQYTEADYEKLESLMYDKFLLQLHSTQILIGPSIEEAIARSKESTDTDQMRIVDRINIDFKIEISILPKAPNLTKFRVSGHMPLLHASVSDRKYKTLMEIIDVAIPRFNETSPEVESSAEVAAGAPSKADVVRRDTKFRFSAQEQALLVVDSDSDLDAASQGGDDDDDDDFLEASEGQLSNVSKLHQKTFELRFKVDCLRGSLFKAGTHNQEPDRPLAELVAGGFGLDFYIQPYEIVAEVILRTFNLEDQIDAGVSPAFRSIIASGASEDSGKDLINVKYAKVNKKSPEYMTVYEGIDTNIDISISTINVIVTRTTILTLLDFIMTTFANPDGDKASKGSDVPKQKQDDSGETAHRGLEAEYSPDKMRVKIDLSTIALILNNDGLRLATLSLASADVGVFLMGKTMRVGARLGNLSLFDDINEGASGDSGLRQLLTIDGTNLADFRYETFDPEQAETYPGYDTSVYLKSGSIKVNFLEEPFRKIFNFMVKFGKMQALFNAARQAAVNQANQIQERANRFQFDIVIQTPIISFPRAPRNERVGHDTITAYLGEIYAANKFLPLDDSTSSHMVNRIEAGIRNVDGSMSDLKMRLSQTQLQILLDLSRSIPGVFSGELDGQDLELEGPPDLGQAIAVSSANQAPIIHASSQQSDLHPELAVTSGMWTKMDLIFNMGDISLELLLGSPSEPIADVSKCSLSKFSLNRTGVKMRLMSDGSMESEILIKSFTINDSRRKETNKYRKIMSSTITDGSQFMASTTLAPECRWKVAQ
ncbi:hypothetical protein ABW19_dt0201163 [Dactylella cylindrospora]|nr:hypothetical protein ABW19_dt0201163 [Dactylella cylindrospora]